MSTPDAESLWFPTVYLPNVEIWDDIRKTNVRDSWRIVPNEDFFYNKVEVILYWLLEIL